MHVVKHDVVPTDKNLKKTDADSCCTALDNPGPGDPTPCNLDMSEETVCAKNSKES